MKRYQVFTNAYNNDDEAPTRPIGFPTTKGKAEDLYDQLVDRFPNAYSDVFEVDATGKIIN